MAGHGNHSLEPAHPDDATLEAYALELIPPDQADTIKQHLEGCPVCAARLRRLSDLHASIAAGLHRALDSARPKRPLDFARVASEWRKPPRRVSAAARLARLMSGILSVIAVALFALTLTVLALQDHQPALSTLRLAESYNGPPAVVAAAVEEGVAIVALDAQGPRVVRLVPNRTPPGALQIAPDGRWVAFEQNQTLHLIETRAAGTAVKLELGERSGWSWAPEGHTLAYTDGRGQLALFDPAEQMHTLLVPAAERAWGPPIWSPVGDRIAYATAALPGDDPAAPSGVWQVDLATGYRIEQARTPASGAALLAPVAWLDDGAGLLAWSASELHAQPALYRIGAGERTAVTLDASAPVQGRRLAWPVNARGQMLAVRQGQVVIYDLLRDEARPIPERLRQPAVAAWSPAGTWLALVVPGQPGGGGLYLYAPEKGYLRQIRLPAGAAEKSVSWAGPEHLFVIRQPDGSVQAELWLVSIAGDRVPQRLLSGVALSQPGAESPHNTIAAHAVTVPAS